MEDDLLLAGLGFTAKLWGAALLFAVREQRVLLEIPSGECGRRNPDCVAWQLFSNHTVMPRWCDQPPNTLQCFYQAWTHCPAPPITKPSSKHVAVFVGGQVVSSPSLPQKYRTPPVLMMSLRRLHIQHNIWGNSRHMINAIGFLFRARPRIVSIGECIMRRAALVPGRFTSVHVRYSAEKRAEAAKLGWRMPSIDGSERVAHMLARAQPGAIFLQTASDEAVDAFERFAHRNHLRLAYTNNTRSDHDSWGGWGAVTTPQTMWLQSTPMWHRGRLYRRVQQARCGQAS